MKHGRSLSYDEAWEEGRNTASQNFQSADGTMQSEKNTATEGGEIRFSMRENFSDAVKKLETISDQEYIKDKKNNPFLFVMQSIYKVWSYCCI